MKITAAQLIQELQKLPQDGEVIFWITEYSKPKWPNTRVIEWSKEIDFDKVVHSSPAKIELIFTP